MTIDRDALIAKRLQAADEFAKKNYDEFVPAPIAGGMTYSFNSGWNAALDAILPEVQAQTLEDAATEFENGLGHEDLKHRTAEAPKGWTDESIHDAIMSSGPVMDWMRDRAARYRKGATDE